MARFLFRCISGGKSAGRIGCLLLLIAVPARAATFGVAPVQLGYGGFNSMVIDAANTKHIATFDLLSHHLIYGTQPDFSGWSFEIVDATGNVGQYCSLALDGLGNPHISYYDATTGALKYAHKSGGFWVTEFADNVSGNVGLNTSIAMDSAGNPHILYNDASQLNVRYASRSGAGVWTRENIDLGQTDQLRLDRFDRPHMVFHNSNGLGTFIRYGVRTLATTTFDTIELISPGSGFSGAISLDLDVSGNPNVSYAAGCNLHYARKLGGTWTVFPVDNVSGVVKATSLRLDQDGSPRIAYQVDPGAVCSSVPGSPGNLMFAYKPAEFNYWVRQLVASGTPTSGVSPSLALSATNNPVILFSRSPENDLLVANGALVNGLFASPNTVRPGGQVPISLFGSGFDAGPTLVAQLQHGSTVLNYIQSGVAQGAPSISLTFDLTGAPTGAYSLIFVNSAGGDTIPDAVLIHDEAVDLTRLTTNPSPEITPAISGPQGGNRLVFASGRETGSDLFVRDLGNSLSDLSAYRLTNSHTAEFPSWRSDDARIVYHDVTADRLYVMDAQSGTILGFPVQLNTDGPARNPSWNPQSDLIAYDNGTGIYMISYPGNVVTPLVPSGIDPDWAPDGQSLVYTVDEGISGKSIRERRVLPTLGSETVLVPAGGYQNFGPQWSPDGQWVAFSSNRPTGSDFNVWVTDSRGRGWLFPITTNAAANEAQVAWGKDGQSLSYVSNASGSQDVIEASNLPMFHDSDQDGVPDLVDTCPAESLLLGQIDQNQDGCPDLASSFRFTRYWAADRFPLTIERDPTGDPAITDGSEFTAYNQAFAAWAAQGPILSGNLVNGSQNAVTGDGHNTLTFTDSDGFIFGTVAITFSTVADEDTTIGGRVYHRGEIVDSDILFNTLHYTFSTPSSPGPAGSFDLQSVTTHELGHFFGFGHSTLQKSTMFYVAYRGAGQQTLEPDDIVLAKNGYHDLEGAVPTLSVEGKVLRGEDGVTPVPGAAVFAITATNDTIQMTVSGVDGTYRFFDLPEPTRIFIAPLDGSAVVNGLTPSGISADLATVAKTDFLSEYYDGAAESNADFGTSGFLIPAYPQMGANILTNPDLTGPQVVSISPADGTTNVPASTSIVIGFDERIDVSTISGNLRLRDLTSGQGVGGQAAFLTPSNLLVFTPTGPLAYNVLYELTVGPGITDQVGNPMGTTVTAQFTIQSQPPVAVTGAAPAEVPIGGTLVISGTGFAPTPGGVNLVNFTGGTVATAYAATLDQLFVTVPPGTQSGNINVVVNGESSNDFSIVIVPAQAPPVGVLLGNSPLGGDPRKVAITPSGAFAYVATSVGVTAVDASPTSATFLQATPIAIEGGSRGVAAHPDGQRVFAVSSNPAALDVIDGVPTSSFFNTVTQTIPLAAEPLGIAIEPGGAHALVAFSDRIASFSLTPGPTFGLEVRNWSQLGVTFLGDVSVSADDAEAYAAAAGGKVAVLGQAPAEGIVGLLASGTTPHETAGTPPADAFFSVDESGMIHRFAARGPLQGSLTLGGSYNGLALSPDGGFAYALNFTLNRVDVVDALSLTPVLLTSFSTGVDPVDLAVGGGGRYFYVAVDKTNVLEVYDGHSGVLVKSVFPRSGGDQTLITVAGTGFDPVALNNSVHIGAAVAPVVGVNAAGTALTVLQSGVVSGPLRVTTGGQNSNPVQYKGVNLDQTPFIGMGALNDAIIPDIANLLETPDGRWLIGLRDDGSMTVLGADPAQPNFLRPVQVLSNTETQVSAVGPMVITSDGKKIYVGESEGSRVTVFALSGSSTAPLSRVGAITSPTMALASFVLAMTPDGSRLLVLSNVDKVVYEVATANDSLLNTGVADAMGAPLANPGGMAVDPRGHRLYVSDGLNAVTGVVVFDLDPASPTYRQSVGNVNLGSGFSGAVVASPRGDFLYCATLYTLAVNVQFNVSVVDIRPQSATYLQSLGTHPVGVDSGPVLAPNHSGNIVYLLASNAPGTLAAYSNDGSFAPIAPGPASARLSGRRALVASLDDARLYVPALGGGVYVTDVSGVNSYHITSGDGQVGVANQPLPAPLVIDAEKSGGEPAEGTVVVYTGLNGNFGPGIPSAITATNAQGFAQASYVNGAVAGPDRVDATSAAGTLQFFLNVVGDTSAAPPQLLTVTPGPNDRPGDLTNVAADFSKAIVPGTVTSVTFTLRVPGGAPLSGSYTFANQGRRVVLDPAAPLAFNATYEVDLASGLQDYNGNPLTNPGTFLFTTGPAPTLSLSAVNATAALPGNVIVLSGSGFNGTAAQNTVLFSGGAAVTPTQGDQASLSVLVPSTAVSGPVRVVVGPDSSNTLPFTVLGFVTPLNQTFDVIQVPSSGQSIAILPNGTRAYMTSPSANTVVPILVATGAAENAIAVGQYPFGVAAAPNSAKVYVSNFLSNTISVIGTDPLAPGFHTVINTIPTELNPSGLVVNPDGRTLYVCNYGSSTLSFIDIDPNSATYNSATASVTIGSSSKAVGVSPDGTTLIVGTSTAVLLLNTSDGSAVASVTVGSSSKGVGVSPDGAFAVVLLDDGQLVLIDIRPGVPTDQRAVASVTVGTSSKGVGVSPDGGSVYVTQSDGTVDVYQIVALGGGAAVAQPVTSLYSFKFVTSIQVGENPIGLAIDPVSGLLLVVNSGDNTISFINISDVPMGASDVTVDVDPNTIKPTSQGNYISAAIQFPTFLNPMDVVLSSVRLNATVPAETTLSALTDKNGDGILERNVKFNRQAVVAILPNADSVTVTVSGLIGTLPFSASDKVRFLRPKIHQPHAAQVVAQLGQAAITWASSPDGPADHMDILWSRDNGASWLPIVTGTPDDTSYVWNVPDVPSSRACLIMLVAKDRRNVVLGVDVSADPFTVSDAPVGIEEVIPARFALLPAAPNPFTALGTKVRFDLPEAARVTLRIYGVDGGVVRTLADNAPYPAGRHAVTWDGRSELGQSVHGGVYFLKIQAGTHDGVQKIVRVTR